MTISEETRERANAEADRRNANARECYITQLRKDRKELNMALTMYLDSGGHGELADAICELAGSGDEARCGFMMKRFLDALLEYDADSGAVRVDADAVLDEWEGAKEDHAYEDHREGE